MTKIISLYNNKGGVAKTTTLFNLAVYLSQQSKKVLIADCDPQCKVTELFFACNEEYDDPDTIELPGTSIYQALKPRFSGETNRFDPVRVALVENDLYKNLFLLRGDLELSLAETSFASALVEAITENIHAKKTYTAMYRLLRTLGNYHSFDYILCDVGSSTGPITRMTVLACDGFFLPVTPDRFCNQAVSVLGRALREWLKRHQQISRMFEPFGLESFPGRPVLLGVISQNFKIHSEGKPKEPYRKWQQRIRESLQRILVSSEGVPTRNGLPQEDPFVAQIWDVGPLAPVAQMFGRAIFDVQREHTVEASTAGQACGDVWNTWKRRKEEYRDEMQRLTECLP